MANVVINSMYYIHIYSYITTAVCMEHFLITIILKNMYIVHGYEKINDISNDVKAELLL